MVSRVGLGVLVVVLTGCGRIGFEAVSTDAAPPIDAPPGTDAGLDAAPDATAPMDAGEADAAAPLECAGACAAAGLGTGACAATSGTLLFGSGFEAGVDVSIDASDTQYWVDITGSDRGFVWPNDLPATSLSRMQTQLSTMAAPFTDYLRIALGPTPGPYGTSTRALLTEVVMRQPAALSGDNNRFQYNMPITEASLAHVYVRMWIRPTADLASRTGYYEPAQVSHVSGYLVSFSIDGDPRRLIVDGQGDGWSVSATTPFPLAGWVLLEIDHVSSALSDVGHIRVWQNGALVIDRLGPTHPVGVPPTRFNFVQHELAETALAAGPSSQAIDDVELWDGRPCPAGTACLGASLCAAGEACACTR